MNTVKMEDLLLQLIEHERGSLDVYGEALNAVSNAELKHEWEDYLSDVRDQLADLQRVCDLWGVDQERETTGRSVVRSMTRGLVEAVKFAVVSSEPVDAELVACKCVLLNETNQLLNWQLLRHAAEQATVTGAEELRAACERAARLSDEHVRHAKEWYRDLCFAVLELDERLSSEPRPETRAVSRPPANGSRVQAGASEAD